MSCNVTRHNNPYNISKTIAPCDAQAECHTFQSLTPTTYCGFIVFFAQGT